MCGWKTFPHSVWPKSDEVRHVSTHWNEWQWHIQSDSKLRVIQKCVTLHYVVTDSSHSFRSHIHSSYLSLRQRRGRKWIWTIQKIHSLVIQCVTKNVTHFFNGRILFSWPWPLACDGIGLASGLGLIWHKNRGPDLKLAVSVSGAWDESDVPKAWTPFQAEGDRDHRKLWAAKFPFLGIIQSLSQWVGHIHCCLF